MDKWLKGAPGLEELVAERMDGRRSPRAGAALVITTYGNPALLQRHLDALGRQKWKGFDIIIVYGENDRFIEAPAWAGILHLREKGRNGCSGAYYIGELAALEDGYEVVILADDDCMPVSDDLVGSLVEEVKGGTPIAIPRLGSPEAFWKPRVPHYYGAVSASVLRKAGLTFLPLFFGGDDVEFISRMKRAGFMPKHMEAYARHPAPKPFLIDASWKRYYYSRGELEAAILNGGFAGALAYSAMGLLMAASLAAFGRTGQAAKTLHGLWDGSWLVFFQARGAGGDGGPQAISKEPEADMVFDSRQEAGRRVQGPNMMIYSGQAGEGLLWYAWKCAQVLAGFPRYIGKRMVFRGGNSALSLPAMAMARSAYLMHEGKAYEVFSGRGVFSIAAGLLLFALFLPLVLPLALCLSARGSFMRAWKGATSMGYGLASIKRAERDA